MFQLASKSSQRKCNVFFKCQVERSELSGITEQTMAIKRFIALAVICSALKIKTMRKMIIISSMHAPNHSCIGGVMVGRRTRR